MYVELRFVLDRWAIPEFDELTNYRVVLNLSAISLEKQIKADIQAVAQEQVYVHSEQHAGNQHQCSRSSTAVAKMAVVALYYIRNLASTNDTPSLVGSSLRLILSQAVHQQLFVRQQATID
jgi:hypothetical protein